VLLPVMKDLSQFAATVPQASVQLSATGVSWSASLQFHPCYIPEIETFTRKLLAPVLSDNQI